MQFRSIPKTSKITENSNHHSYIYLFSIFPAFDGANLCTEKEKTRYYICDLSEGLK